MEAIAASEGRSLASYPLAEQEALWVRVKREGV
jgi:ATP diphosphatase